MNGRRVISCLQIVGCGAGSLVAWTLEVRGIAGWAGTRWIYSFPWSSLVVSLLVGCAALAALRHGRFWTLLRSFGLVGGVAVVSLSAFFLARWGILNSETVALAPGLSGTFLRIAVLPILGSFLLATIGIHLVSSTYRPAGTRSLLRVAVAITLTLPISLLTVKLFPDPSRVRDSIHAVKMGYPMFWIHLLLGWALWPLGSSERQGETT